MVNIGKSFKRKSDTSKCYQSKFQPSKNRINKTSNPRPNKQKSIKKVDKKVSRRRNLCLIGKKSRKPSQKTVETVKEEN